MYSNKCPGICLRTRLITRPQSLAQPPPPVDSRATGRRDLRRENDAFMPSVDTRSGARPGGGGAHPARGSRTGTARDRKSTRLNSSHTVISYAVFCLKKKKKYE